MLIYPYYTVDKQGIKMAIEKVEIEAKQKCPKCGGIVKSRMTKRNDCKGYLSYNGSYCVVCGQQYWW